MNKTTKILRVLLLPIILPVAIAIDLALTTIMIAPFIIDNIYSNKSLVPFDCDDFITVKLFKRVKEVFVE